jgi:Met-10+ like-protein
MQGLSVPVVYALKQNAKRAKSTLEEAGHLDKNYRMVPSETYPNTIALPVIESFMMNSDLEELLMGQGHQMCPLSTKMMGQHPVGTDRKIPLRLTRVQQAILLTVEALSSTVLNFDDEKVLQSALQRIESFDLTLCPFKLEIFGDDRTIVIPPGAFEGDEFWSCIQSLIVNIESPLSSCGGDRIKMEFWKQLSDVHRSSRIVRRGTIDAESHIRQSGHRLVYPHQGIPEKTGPDSPGWIRVTEQGIRQSFDMTRVMFSRGNISEKIRFGKIVQFGEDILDMYAGIGYYTLPAIIRGKARHVVACEWNKDAIYALRHNVHDNNVTDRVTILEGDCRQSATDHNLVGLFDRVSLGLLPSSEGGWKTAVRALKNETGGWLHIHGNVPNSEQAAWAIWTCKSLLDICNEIGRPDDWVVLCNHVEKVKSFAPTVSHFVADIFVGPSALHIRSHELSGSKAGVLRQHECVSCKGDILVPSCALSSTGPLSQSWMK